MRIQLEHRQKYSKWKKNKKNKKILYSFNASKNKLQLYDNVQQIVCEYFIISLRLDVAWQH